MQPLLQQHRSSSCWKLNLCLGEADFQYAPVFSIIHSPLSLDHILSQQCHHHAFWPWWLKKCSFIVIWQKNLLSNVLGVLCAVNLYSLLCSCGSIQQSAVEFQLLQGYLLSPCCLSASFGGWYGVIFRDDGFNGAPWDFQSFRYFFFFLFNNRTLVCTCPQLWDHTAGKSDSNPTILPICDPYLIFLFQFKQHK